MQCMWEQRAVQHIDHGGTPLSNQKNVKRTVIIAPETTGQPGPEPYSTHSLSSPRFDMSHVDQGIPLPLLVVLSVVTFIIR